jgi:hypothetical protein
MANTKISALTALTGANLATDDVFVVVDTSATTTKRITFAELKLGILGTINYIGKPGDQGFGVGICPALPAGYSALYGATDPASNNYGNYQFSDGSVMVWVPAFYYKVGTGTNGLAINRVDVKPWLAFADVAAANADGYALHRAFYNAGVVQAGCLCRQIPVQQQRRSSQLAQERQPAE